MKSFDYVKDETREKLRFHPLAHAITLLKSEGIEYDVENICGSAHGR